MPDKKGGFGHDWGGSWGGESGPVPDPPPNQFEDPSYPVPLGKELGNIPSANFSGEPTTGVLAGSQGALFFSPALLAQNLGNEVDLDSIQVCIFGSDIYVRPPEENNFVFTWGSGGSSRTNDPRYRTQPKVYTAVATLIQTIPPGPTTVIKIP